MGEQEKCRKNFFLLLSISLTKCSMALKEKLTTHGVEKQSIQLIVNPRAQTNQIFIALHQTWASFSAN